MSGAGRRGQMRHLVSAVAVVACLAMSANAGGQETSEEPVVILADVLTHDEESGIVAAAGNVDITSGLYTLLADRIEYDIRGNAVHASGEVVLLEPSGNVVFADEMRLTGDLRDGFISGIRVLMADRSRLAAMHADRTGGNRTQLTNAVYTACDTCGGDLNPPVWQLKASRVVHNQELRRIDYENARLELFGVPVLYTPFFSHPDPAATRQSGFLAPTYVATPHLGAEIEIPYFLALAPHRDITIAPRFTSREGPILAAEYRERTQTGRTRFDASITRPRRHDGAVDDTRGHVEATGRFSAGPTWRWGFDSLLATDDTYLRRYGISDETTLVTSSFVERIEGRDHAAATAWTFREQQEDSDRGKTPTVLPMIDYTTVSPPGPLGQTYTLDASLLSLTRREGVNTARLSATGAWRLPYTGGLGAVYTLTVSLRGDAYVVSGVPHPTDPAAGSEHGLVGRALPQAALEWRFPLTRPGESTDYVLEPIAAVIVAPQGGNPPLIPNEDSLSFEFDDTNLFSASRFPGLDPWEAGPRVNYGVKLGAYGPQSAVTALVGQTARDRSSELFGEGTGLQSRRSDYVGRLEFAAPGIDLSQRFRMDRESFSLRRNEIEIALGSEDLRFGARYVFLGEELSTEELGRREELSLSGRAALGGAWSVSAGSRHDLADDGGLLLAGLGLAYECDCLGVAIQFARRLTRDRDIPRSTSITLQFRLRNLG